MYQTIQTFKAKVPILTHLVILRVHVDIVHCMFIVALVIAQNETKDKIFNECWKGVMETAPARPYLAVTHIVGGPQCGSCAAAMTPAAAPRPAPAPVHDGGSLSGARHQLPPLRMRRPEQPPAVTLPAKLLPEIYELAGQCYVGMYQVHEI